MAHFARIDSNNTVQEVLVVNNEIITDENGDEQEILGQEFLASLGLDGVWLQCSYNKTFRYNFPGFGFAYDEQNDAFIPPKPEITEQVSDWILNEETFIWEPVEA